MSEGDTSYLVRDAFGVRRWSTACVPEVSGEVSIKVVQSGHLQVNGYVLMNTASRRSHFDPPCSAHLGRPPVQQLIEAGGDHLQVDVCASANMATAPSAHTAVVSELARKSWFIVSCGQRVSQCLWDRDPQRDAPMKPHIGVFGRWCCYWLHEVIEYLGRVMMCGKSLTLSRRLRYHVGRCSRPNGIQWGNWDVACRRRNGQVSMFTTMWIDHVHCSRMYIYVRQVWGIRHAMANLQFAMN